jgi:hypothetical protein
MALKTRFVSRITFENFLYTSDVLIEVSKFQHMQSSAPNVALLSFFLKFNCSILEKRIVFLYNSAFAMAILDLISHVQLAALIVMLPA